MQLQFEYHLWANNEILDGDIRDLEAVSTSSGTFLYSATGQGGGVTAYQLSVGGGQAQLSSTMFYSGSAVGTGIGELQTLRVDGVDQLIVGGTDGGGLVGYRLYQTGQLGNRITTHIAGSAGDISEAGSIGTSDVRAVYSVTEGGGLLRTYTTTTSGGFAQQLPSDQDRPDFVMQGETVLQTTTVGDRHFLLAADSAANAVSSFRITNVNTGELDPRDQFGAEDGLGFGTPNVMQTVKAYGATYVLVGAAGSGSLSVMRLFYDGHLEATDHILDTLDTRFDDISALEVVRVGAQVFVIAGGGDDGLSLFTMLPGGRLVHLQSIENNGANGLDNISAIEVVQLGGTLQVFVSASNTPGVMQFSIDVSNMGDLIRDASAGNENHIGTDGDDMMVGGAGDDTMRGGLGDDILVSGYGDGVLQGGWGRDIFVLRPGVGDIRILDFNPAFDSLDLGHLPMLRSTAQLDIRSTGSGLRIDFGDLRIYVNSHNGASLTAAQVFPHDLGSLGTPDRMLILSSPYDPSIPVPRDADPDAPDPNPEDDPNSDPDPAVVPGRAVSGTQNAERIFGSAGNDTVDAAAGNDRIYGRDGNDVIRAGRSHDVAAGGNGNDRLMGGMGRDSIYAGAGDDFIQGNGGNDRVFGSLGNDVVEGGVGHDTVGGFRGNDTLRGGDGDDVVYASWDDDLVGGGAGSDELWGGNGNDTLWGDGGADTIGGGSGDDIIRGGRGNDQIKGGWGDDKAWGDNGADTIRGLNGNDTLAGGDGDDLITGGQGRDRIWGEVGNDTIYAGRDNDVIGGDTGNDDLWGQHGQDRFVFRNNHGDDRIMDFVPGRDEILIEIGNTGYSQLDMRNVNGNAVIDTGPGTITLVGVRYQDLDSDDFLFG